MNIKVKLIATAVGFAGWGALVGWALTADHYEQKLKDKHATNNTLREMLLRESRHNMELRASLEELPMEADVETTHVINEGHIQSVSLDPEPNAFGESIKVSEAENSPGDETSETDVAEETEETFEQTRSNLQNIIDQYTANPEDRDEFINAAVEQLSSNDPPFVIDRTTFAWDEEGENYEKTTVTYYPASRVVLDEDDEVIDDPGVTLGWRNLSRFGDESEDPDVVFVRNRRIMTDFEVVKDEESPLPLHVKYGLGREEFNVAKAAGTLRLREEDT